MADYDTILLPTDGSDAVLSALDHALTLAEDHDATLSVLYVVDRRIVLAADDDADDVRETLRNRGEASFEIVRNNAGDVPVETAVREGVPESVICEFSEETGVDAVVMATHGRTGKERAKSLGSVTEGVVDGSSVPVFVVPVADE